MLVSAFAIKFLGFKAGEMTYVCMAYRLSNLKIMYKFHAFGLRSFYHRFPLTMMAL